MKYPGIRIMDEMTVRGRLVGVYAKRFTHLVSRGRRVVLASRTVAERIKELSPEAKRGENIQIMAIFHGKVYIEPGKFVRNVEVRARKVRRRVKLYEAWKVPGGMEIEGGISPREAKSIGAIILIGSSVRKFRIHHRASLVATYDNNWGDDRHPWKLSENHPVATEGAVDEWIPVDEFASLQEARRVARSTARASAIAGLATKRKVVRS